MKKGIGLIGIGLVGTALAENMLKAGYSVVGFDIETSKRRNLERLGGIPASSPREVARETNRVFLSLMSTDVVRNVLDGPAGLLKAEAAPEYIVDTTTGDPMETTAIAQTLKEKGIFFLDSPISGSSEQIRHREGVLMVGGDPHAYEACKDLFSAVAKKFFYVGPSGDGSKAKLASNLILGLNRLVLAEGLVFAERLGLDLESFLPLLKETPAYSCSMDVKGQKMIEGDFKPESRISQHNKDLGIILDYAKRLGQPLPLAQLHNKIIETAMKAGDGNLDNCAVIKQIRRMADNQRNGMKKRDDPRSSV
ncbi:NAD(P)-dependent oxidoreductase [bacterium]|nr:NAD(P)-dependent oxidoreductase [bacterium]